MISFIGMTPGVESKMLESSRDGRPVLNVGGISPVETPEAVFGDLRGRVGLPPDDAMTAPVDPSTWSHSDIADLLG
jgi:hypothetical protein